MTDTPRTKQLKEVRQKRLTFLEKKAETSNGEPVSKNGIRSSRAEKTVCKSITEERCEDSDLKDATEKSGFNKTKPAKSSGTLEGSLLSGRSSLVFGSSRSSHDVKSSNDSEINKSENELKRIGLVEKCAKKTPRDVKAVVSGRKSTTNSLTDELRSLNDTSLKRPPKENGVDIVRKIESLSRSATNQAVRSETVGKGSLSSQNEECKRKSYDMSQDQSTHELNDEQPGTSWHINSNSVSVSTSSKKSAKQGFDTYRVVQEDLPEKSRVAQKSDLVDLDPVTSRRSPAVKPSMSQSTCFSSSDVVKMKDDARIAVKRNDGKKPQAGLLGRKDASGKTTIGSVPLQNEMPSNSVALENEDLQRLFRSSTLSADNPNLKTGNSFAKTSSVGISSNNGKSDETLTQSKNFSKSLTKSSVSLQTDKNRNSTDKGTCSDSTQSDVFSSHPSSSRIKSVASGNQADDSVNVSEENGETMMKHLRKSIHSSRQQVKKKPASLEPPPSESVEYSVPDFLEDIPTVGAVQRSQIPFSESNDFVQSSYVTPNSEVLASETTVSTLASTLNFDSVNLELVLGKDRMDRLLKNIMEIDGSSDFNLKASTITDVSASGSHDMPRKHLEDKPQSVNDSSVFECRDSRDTDNVACAFNGAKASCESLGLKTHRPDDRNDASQTPLNASISSSVRVKKEKLKCSFLVDEIYAEAQMLKEGQGCGGRSDAAMAMVPDALGEVRNMPELPVEGFVNDRNARDFKGTRGKLHSEEDDKVKECTTKTTVACSNTENGCTRESLQIDPNGISDTTEKKRHQRRETRKREVALADSKEEHIKGIRRKMQQQQSQGIEDHGRPEGIAENNSSSVNCYMNPAIDRYFKSLENLSFDMVSPLPKTPLENSLEAGQEFSVVGRSLPKDNATVADAGDEFRQQLRVMKKDLFEAIDRNNDTLFGKITSVVEKDEPIQIGASGVDRRTLESSLEDEGKHQGAGTGSKNIRSLSSESQVKNIVANVSHQDPVVSTSAKVGAEEKRSNQKPGNDAGKLRSSNPLGSGCTTTSVWNTDQTSDGKIPGTSDISASSLTRGTKKETDNKKLAFTPILNVRDSEEFEYSEVGKRGMGSFGEFFKDEMSINLRDSGDGKSRNSSGFPLKSIVEDCAMDSVNYDYVLENKLDFSEELKATLHLNLDDSLDVEQTRARMDKRETVVVKEMKEDKSNQSAKKSSRTGPSSMLRSVSQKLREEESVLAARSSKTQHSEDVDAVCVKETKEDKSHHQSAEKSSRTGPSRKSVSRSPERQQVDVARSASQKLREEENVPAARSSKTQHSEDVAAAAGNNDDIHREFIHHLVNDARFKKTGLESRSSESLSSAPHVPKLQLNADSSTPLKSLSRSLVKTSKVSSSRPRPVSASLSAVLGRAKVAWKDDDVVMDVPTSVVGTPVTRQRPWSAKVLPRSSFPDDSGFDLSRSVGEAALVGKIVRPSSVGPRSRRKLVSGDVELGQSIEDFGGRHVQERRRPASAQSVNKSKGQSRRTFRFATEDYEKYSALSPRIQAGELSMLTSFPDEILLKIFSFLPRCNLSRCARVCQHFFRVAMDNSLWRCIELEERILTDEHLAAIGRKMPSSLHLLQCTGDKVTSNGLRELFWECSDSLRELRFSGCSKGHLTGQNLLLHATNRCRNITHLDGSWTNISSQGIIAFSDESERLVSVCLNGCQSISDEAVQTLVARHGKHLVTLELLGLFGLTNVAVETIGACCKNLVTLTLGQCWKLTDGCLAQLSINMPLLENLDLRGCKQIKDQTIHQLVKNCGHLTSLSLANCPNLTDSSLAEIAVQCPRLRSLDVCGCGKLTNVGLKTLVSGCSLLKYLDLSSTSISHRSVTAIASYCSRRLEVLKLNFCKQMNMECLVRLVKNCKRLKKLYVYGVKGLHGVQELKITNPDIWIEM